MSLVALCTPIAELISPKYHRAVMEMQNATTQHQFLFVEVDTMIIGKARNMIVQSALPHNPEVLFWIDADTLVPPHAGQLIDQALDLGIVSGIYYNRRPPFTPQVYTAAKEDELFGMYWPDIKVPDSGLHRRDAIGAGCVAIRMDIYHQLEDLWKPRVETAYKLLKEVDRPIAEIVKHLSPWYEFLDRKGEDLYFCERIGELGLDIWINADVQCGHLAETLVTKEYFDYLVENDLVQKMEYKDGEMVIPPVPVG